MNRNQILTCTLSFLTTFIFYSSGLTYFPQLPRSIAEKELADLLHEQIVQNNLNEFINILNNYPKYINLIYFYFTYKSFVTPLQHAAMLGRNEFIDELLKRGADPTLTTLVENSTLLHISSLSHTTKKLIDLGLDLEARNYQGMTPLLLKVFKTNLNRELILTLLEAGADPNAKTDISELTTLHILFKPRHANSNREDLLGILKDLLTHGARIDARTKQGATPLHFAAYNNDVQAIKMLINKAKDQIGTKKFVNMTDLDGNTALAIAYKTRSREAITQLLKLGANPFFKNNKGVSVNGDVHLRSSEGEVFDFNKFVSDQIARYFKPANYYFAPSAHCAQPLTI